MKKIKIGLLKETKTPPDKRAALTPTTVKQLQDSFPNVEICIQPSEIRCFKDEEYLEKGFTLKNDLTNCNILLGIKEVEISTLIPNKTYLFFAHVAKKQEHNRPLLKAIIDKGITLIDYEFLTDNFGRRIVAFGYWAGIVGAYNGMRAWGLKNKEFNLPPAHNFKNKQEMFEYIQKNIKISKPFKIVITGGGRVASGVVETLKAFGIKEVIPEDLFVNTFEYSVFTRLDPCHYVRHKQGKEFELKHFFEHPQEYESTFRPYTWIADMYIAAHFWDPHSPKFFTAEDTRHPRFNIKVVADISCDVDNGPVGTTIRASSIEVPFYDFNPQTGKEEPAFSNEQNITVMAVDNLPGELPRDSSEDFSTALVEKVIPYLLGEDTLGIINRATIVKKGKLTEKFKYLENWVNE